jgi:uncharacterized RmlC-like cupin family protein
MRHPTEIITIRPERERQTRQQLPYFVGISASTTCAKGISMWCLVLAVSTKVAVANRDKAGKVDDPIDGVKFNQHLPH